MNNNRRKQLRKWLTDLEAIKGELEDICSDEEDYFANMPENLQGSIRGTDSEDAIDKMYEAIDSLDEAISTVEDVI